MALPATIDEVLARLEAIDRRLPARDGVACFNRMYLTVTRLVGERVTAGFFADPAAMELLDVVFANLYLEAVDADAAGQRVPRAWAPLFARRTDSRVLPLQFAVAGMNAHINHDLAVAVVATCTQRGAAPDRGSFHDDYLRINQLLAQIDQDVRRSYLTELAAEVDRDVSPALDLVSNWSIESARDAAWINAEVFWQLRHLTFTRSAFRHALAKSVGLVTATLLAPVPMPVR